MSEIWSKQSVSAPPMVPAPVDRTVTPTMYKVGNMLEVTEMPLLYSAPPKPNEPSEFEKQLPYILFSILLGFVIQKTIFKRGKKS